MRSNLARVSEAMQLFRSWARGKGLQPSETAYVVRTPGRPALQFSRSGDATIERLYRTHWVSPELSECEGLLVEPQAWREAEREIEAERE